VRLAPVAVFAHRRPTHLRRVLDALDRSSLSDKSDVVIFSDGPRSDLEAENVLAVRKEASRRRRFRHLEIVSSPTNLGLANSVTSGVGTMLEAAETVIVLEDDLVVAPAFLEFMNEGLQRFRDVERVASVHGYAYPTAPESPFFLRGADCWGWATWRRGWEHYEPDGVSLLKELQRRKLTDLFDFDGTYGFTEMLEGQNSGRVDSWAIRWYASTFLANLLTLYPGRTLVRNIGNDGSGTHTGITEKFDTDLASDAPSLEGLVVEESAEARRAFQDFFSSGEVPRPRSAEGFGSRLRARISSRIRRSSAAASAEYRDT
jgi:hypothetical protein